MHFSPKSWHCAAAVLGVATLSACASTDYHYSQLYGKRYYRAPIDTYDVTIVRVDGKDTLIRPVLVDPGVRKVVVQGPPGGTCSLGEEREIALDVRPCTRYYLVAVQAEPAGFRLRRPRRLRGAGRRLHARRPQLARCRRRCSRYRHLRVEFPGRAAARWSRSTTSRSRSRPARSSAWSASRAPASR